MLMDAVDAGLGATLQPWAAVARFADAQQRFTWPRWTTRRYAASTRCAACRTTSCRPPRWLRAWRLADVARALVREGRAGLAPRSITIRDTLLRPGAVHRPGRRHTQCQRRQAWT